MQPMHPRKRAAIVSACGEPNAEELMQEYERLQSMRFLGYPETTAKTLVAAKMGTDPSERLKEVHRLLFGPRQKA